MWYKLYDDIQLLFLRCRRVWLSVWYPIAWQSASADWCLNLSGVASHTNLCVKRIAGEELPSVDEFVSRFPHRFFRCDEGSQWQRSAAGAVIGRRRSQCARPLHVCPRHERDRSDARTVRPGPLRRIVLLTRFAWVADCLSTNVFIKFYVQFLWMRETCHLNL